MPDPVKVHAQDALDKQVQIQHAASVLQDAIEKWEAATAHLHSKDHAGMTTGFSSDATVAAKVGADSPKKRAGLDSIAEEVEPNSVERVEPTVENAAAPAANKMAENLIEAMGGGSVHEVFGNAHSATWLRRALEDEQQKSYQKILGMMQVKEAQAAMNDMSGCMGWGQPMPYNSMAGPMNPLVSNPLWALQAQAQAQM